MRVRLAALDLRMAIEARAARIVTLNSVYCFTARGVKAVVAMISTISLRMLKSWAAKNRRSSGSSW